MAARTPSVEIPVVLACCRIHSGVGFRSILCGHLLLSGRAAAEVGVRLSLYKRLASAHDEAEVANIGQEMEDRFGPPPAKATKLAELMRLKAELRRLMVLGCEASKKSVSLHLRDDTPLDPAKIGELCGKRHSPYRITPDGRLSRRAADGESFADVIALADKMLVELAECVRSPE